MFIKLDDLNEIDNSVNSYVGQIIMGGCISQNLPGVI